MTKYRRTFAVLVAPFLVMGGAVACAKIAGIDDLTVGDCKGGACDDGAANDAPVPDGGDGSTNPNAEGGFDASEPCPGDAGPLMVRVGTEANNFCIDSTEVTIKDYTAFTIAKGADAGGQTAECKWNTSYAPAAVGGEDDLPIAGIDWCDAYAYCHWAGKRLCGKQVNNEFEGGVTEADLGDINTHEWLLACSNIGQLRYPYGGTEEPTTCNTLDDDAGHTLPVGTKTGCQGGFPGIFDMIGNTWEWFDGPCLPDGGADAGDAGPAKDECFVKGGAYLNAGSSVDCRVDGRGATRDRRGPDIGLRCCSD